MNPRSSDPNPARDLTVRLARPCDVEPIARIYVDSWNDGFGDIFGTRPRRDDDPERWAATLTAAPDCWWVAEVRPARRSAENPAVVGFVGIGPSRDPIDPSLGELDTIAVDPAYWRIGVGRALMATALEALARKGFREAILWTVSGYARGQRFYLATGWRPDGGLRDEGRQCRFRRRLESPDPSEPKQD